MRCRLLCWSKSSQIQVLCWCKSRGSLETARIFLLGYVLLPPAASVQSATTIKGSVCSTAPYSHKMSAPALTIYGTEWCPHCQAAKADLQPYNPSFVDCEKNQAVC